MQHCLQSVAYHKMHLFFHIIIRAGVNGPVEQLSLIHISVNTVCGVFLVAVGILMMTGLMGRFLAVLA